MRFNIPSYVEISDEETESEGEGRRGGKRGKRSGKKKPPKGAHSVHRLYDTRVMLWGCHLALCAHPVFTTSSTVPVATRCCACKARRRADEPTPSATPHLAYACALPSTCPPPPTDEGSDYEMSEEEGEEEEEEELKGLVAEVRTDCRAGAMGRRTKQGWVQGRAGTWRGGSCRRSGHQLLG